MVLFSLFMRRGRESVCMCMHPWRPEEGTGYFEARLRVVYEPPLLVLGNKLILWKSSECP